MKVKSIFCSMASPAWLLLGPVLNSADQGVAEKVADVLEIAAAPDCPPAAACLGRYDLGA